MSIHRSLRIRCKLHQRRSFHFALSCLHALKAACHDTSPRPSYHSNALQWYRRISLPWANMFGWCLLHHRSWRSEIFHLRYEVCFSNHLIKILVSSVPRSFVFLLNFDGCLLSKCNIHQKWFSTWFVFYQPEFHFSITTCFVTSNSSAVLSPPVNYGDTTMLILMKVLQHSLYVQKNKQKKTFYI